MTRRAHRGRASLVVLGITALAAALWCTQPQNAWAIVLYEGIGYGAAMLIVFGVVRYRPDPSWPWLMFALAITCNATGDLLWDLTEVVGDAPGYTSALASICYLVGYPVAIIGAIGLLGRGRRRDLTVLIDGALYGLATWLAIWVLTVNPLFGTAKLGFWDWLPTILYPPLDLIVLVAVWRVGRGELRRSKSWQLLTSSLAFLLTADVLLAMLGVPNTGVWNRILSVGYLLSYGMIAAAAWHPDMRYLEAAPKAVARPSSPRARIVGLGISISVPMVLLAMWPEKVGLEPAVIAIAGLVLVAGYLCRTLTVVDLQHDAEAALAWQATHDVLTGLPNRVALVEQIGAALLRARTNGTGCAILFCDLDDFKVINDSLGHTMGDNLLIAVATRLREALRTEDYIARLGGDEFVVLCENLHHDEDTQAAADRIVRALHEPFAVGRTELHVDASVGMVTNAQAISNDADTLLRDADLAMYRAKEQGRGHVQAFDASMHDRIHERLETETALRNALINDELFLVYQPVISLADGKLIAREALLRWERPDVGIVMPQSFVSIAERSGLIINIGSWTLRNAARDLRKWQDNGETDVRVAVNMSARELLPPEMAKLAIEIVTTERVNPDRIILEITESALLEPTDSVRANLAVLHEAGFRFAIDDFGTGYSSLAYLKDLDVDTIKIDRTFVNGLGHDTDDAVLVQTIITMAHSLGIKVTAEGVEREEQLALLESFGCDAVQGFLLGQPNVIEQEATIPTKAG